MPALCNAGGAILALLCFAQLTHEGFGPTRTRRLSSSDESAPKEPGQSQELEFAKAEAHGDFEAARAELAPREVAMSPSVLATPGRPRRMAKPDEALKDPGQPELTLPPKVLAFNLCLVATAWLWLAIGSTGVLGRERLHGDISLWVAAVLYYLVLPLSSLLLGFTATCEDGAPLLAYKVYGMFLLAHAGLTAYAMCQVGLKFWEFPGRNPMTWTPVLFLLTLLEHMDMFTDALFVGTAAACSDTIADQFEASWAAVPRVGWWLGPLMAKLTFGGLAFSCFVLAAYLPQLVYLPSPAVPLFLPAAGLLLGALAIGYSSWAVGVAMALPLTVAAINFGERMWRGNFTRQLEDRKEGALWVGMVVFQNFHYIVGDEVPKSVRLVAFGLVRLLYENLLQLWLQSSYFAFTFEATGDTAKAKILVSLALGLGVSVSKLPEMFSAWYDEMRLPADCRITVYETLRRCGEPRRDNICPCVSVLLFCLVALGPVLAVAAKVYFAYACPDHVWNILGGCVVLD